MNFRVNKQEYFQTTSSVHSTNKSIDQMPAFYVFRKVHSVMASEFSTVYDIVLQV